MPTVRIASNGGQVIVVDGVAYSLRSGQPTLGVVNAVASQTNVPSRDWGNDDNNIPGGPYHRIWSACECAVAGWGAGNQASVSASGFGTLDFIFTAPSQGVAKCAHSNLHYDYPTQYYVRPFGTGTDIMYGGSDTTVGWAGPSVWPNLASPGFSILLNAGDIVKVESVGGTGQYLWFLPYVY